MLYQSESIVHYFETNMQYLQDECGSDLTENVITDHFELNPLIVQYGAAQSVSLLWPSWAYLWEQWSIINAC
jgi:hypothetical protein